jgi:hypothetical protein
MFVRIVEHQGLTLVPAHDLAVDPHPDVAVGHDQAEVISPLVTPRCGGMCAAGARIEKKALL